MASVLLQLVYRLGTGAGCEGSWLTDRVQCVRLCEYSFNMCIDLSSWLNVHHSSSLNCTPNTGGCSPPVPRSRSQHKTEQN